MKPKKHNVRALLITGLPILAACVSGCVALTSKPSSTDHGTGLAYYLPEGWLKITIVEQAINFDPPTPPAGRTASTKIIRRTQRLLLATNQFDGDPRVAIAQAESNVEGEVILTNSVDETTTEYQPLLKALEVKQKPSITNYWLTVEPEIHPDRSARFLLNTKSSIWSDDFSKLAVTNGLLTSVSLTNSDQSLAVLSNLVLTAVEFAKVPSGPSGNGVLPEDGVKSSINYTTNVYLLQPNDTRIRQSCSVSLRDFNFDLSDFPTNLAKPGPKTESGVYYRPLEAFRLKWHLSATGEAGAAIVYLPSKSSLLRLDHERSLFVNQSFAATFQKGVPIETVLNKPSQAAAFSAFPLILTRSLVGLPTNLVQFKIDYANRNTELSKAQGQQITNLLQLLEAQKNLNAYRASNAPPAGASTD